MSQVSIIGGTIWGNRGAEAMLVTIINQLRVHRGDTLFNVYSYYPDIDRKLISDKDVSVYSATPLSLIIMLPVAILYCIFRLVRLQKVFHGFFPLPLRRIAESRVLIDISGVSYMDGRERFLPYNILINVQAFLVGIPVVKFAQGLGPLKHLLTRIAARVFLRQCDFICARGKITYGHLVEFFGQKIQYRKCMDVAFLHVVGNSLSHENEEYLTQLLLDIAATRNAGGVVVGVCPNSLLVSKGVFEGVAYIEVISEAINELLNQGINVVLFPNATREKAPGTLRNNDLPVIKVILEKIAPLAKGSTCKLFVVEKDINADGIKQVIALSDVLVVSRFHAMIGALSLAKPLIVIGWSHKYLEVLSEFGLERNCYDYSSLTGSLAHKVNDMLAHKEEYHRIIKIELPRVMAEAQWQIDFVCERYLS